MQNRQERLLLDLAEHRVDFFPSEPFPGYERVFAEIENSDVFVALIDHIWTSSTWKMRELSYAAGLSAEKSGSFIAVPKLCLVYDTTGNVNVRHILSRPGSHTFDGTFPSLQQIISDLHTPPRKPGITG